MGLLGWILLGGIAGWIATSITGVGENKGCIFNTIVGTIGSVVGGLIFSFLGKTGVTGFNPWSLFVAAVGATVFLLVARWLSSGTK